MTKKDLIDALAARNGSSRAAAERALDSVLAVVQEGLERDGVVRLTGIGKLYTCEAAARLARNPRTGESVEVPVRQRLRFKASKKFTAAEAAAEAGDTAESADPFSE